jgi:hypothetical protein
MKELLDELLESIDVIIEKGKGVLTDDEIQFMEDCKKSTEPKLYLQFYYYKKDPIIISIFYKLENLI